MVIERRPAHPARRRDGLRDRARTGERQRKTFHQSDQRADAGHLRRTLRQNGVRPGAQTPALTRRLEEVARDATHLLRKLPGILRRLEVDDDSRLRHCPECAAELVERAAFETILRDEQLSRDGALARAGRDVFQRLPGARPHRRGPRTFPATIRRSERRNGDPELLQDRRPGTVGTRLRPRPATQRENHGIRLVRYERVFGPREIELPARAGAQAGPAVPHGKLHAARPQPLHPAAQQRGRFQRARIDATGRGDEGFHTQPIRPRAQSRGIEVREQRRPARGVGVARGEKCARLVLRQVQPAATSHEKLATDRRLRVVERDPRAARRGDFRRAQTCRTAADDCNVRHPRSEADDPPGAKPALHRTENSRHRQRSVPRRGRAVARLRGCAARAVRVLSHTAA